MTGNQVNWPFVPELDPFDLVAVAQSQGITALIDCRLKAEASSGAARTPALVISAFADAAREDLLVSMQFESETRRILALMAKSGLPGLLLKGSALAYWAYPEPHLRCCSDVDLLLASRESAEILANQLVLAGYERAETLGDLVAYELMCHRKVAGGWRVEIDVHWRMANSPLFSDAFPFAELMAESLPIPALAPNARGLGPVHALLHACIHRAINLAGGGDGDKLKWLYDLIVLIDGFAPADWQKMVQIAIDKKLAGVVLSGLEKAAATFQRELPADIVATLRQAAASEPLNAQRLSDWRYMERKTFETLPGTGMRLRWLWQRLFPSRDQLVHLYGDEHQSYAALILERFKRAIRRA